MPDTASNIVEYTVSEIALSVKRTVEEAYEHVRVRGEVSGFRGRHGSGHAYFTLKDEGAALDAVIWKAVYPRLRFPPQDGLEMVAIGRLTTFPGRSKYQIVIEHLEPAGAGALMALLEERKRTLAAEGLFDAERKRPLPFLPRTVGVVTSPTGAVIRDILHRLRERCPRHVLLWPVRVQGDGAAEEVAAAVRGFNALAADGAIPRPDLLIVARGGGSIEDLWAFNEEAAVRAVAESEIPVISAVGHETDWTLIDLAADLRAPTPTGAAEIAVPVASDLRHATADLAFRQDAAWRRLLDTWRREVAAAGRALPSLLDLLALPRQRLDHAASRLARALARHASVMRQAWLSVAVRLAPHLLEREGERRRERLRAAVRLLDSLSHKAVLKRGFALVRDARGAAIRSAMAMTPGERIELEFTDGKAGAVVDGPQTGRRAARGKRAARAVDQGSLL